MRYLFALLHLSSLSAFAQFEQVPRIFVNHLVYNKMYDEALLVLMQQVNASSGVRADSLCLAIGKIHYTLQQLPLSNSFLDRVSVYNETLFAEAHFFSSFNTAYMMQYDQANRKLHNAIFTDQKWNDLKNFQISGICLLQNNLVGFDSLQNLINPETSSFQVQYQNFIKYRKRIEEEKKKSPLVAGVLSAAVPGLGKVYAGRRGNGLYTFLITGLLAAQAAEAYSKNGVTSARFIIYGSLFTSFYIGNIWGSSLAVSVVKNEKQDATHEQILFDMHIPLRTLFR